MPITSLTLDVRPDIRLVGLPRVIPRMQISPYAGNKSKHDLRWCDDASAIVDPFFGAGGGTLGLASVYRDIPYLVGERSEWQRQYMSAVFETGVEGFVREGMELFERASDASWSWAEFRLAVKGARDRVDPGSGLIQNLGFSNVTRRNSKGLSNIGLSAQKIVGHKAWMAACEAAGPKPKGHKEKIAYNDAIADDFFQDGAIMAGISKRLAYLGGEMSAIEVEFRDRPVSIYNDCDFALPAHGKLAVLLDPPYFCQDVVHFEDTSGKSRKKDLKDSYDYHNGRSLATWDLMGRSVKRLIERGNCQAFLCNYESPEFYKLIGELGDRAQIVQKNILGLTQGATGAQSQIPGFVELIVELNLD